MRARGPDLLPVAAAPSLSERELAHLWHGQRFPQQALRTVAGEPLVVVQRGLPGRGPGPDYRDAIIRAGGRTMRGDVELHVRASDFRRHGHHRDAAYDGLALHLVFRADGDETSTALRSGRRAPLAALEPWLAGRREEIGRWLARPALWQEPCRTAVRRLGPEAVAAWLDRLGDIRFRLRARTFRRLAAEEREGALYAALLEGLGYGGNREAFAALAERLPWRRLRAALIAAPIGEREEVALARLREAARGLAWRTVGLRPANRPERRLAAAAVLFARYAEAGLAAGLAKVAQEDAGEAVAALTVRSTGGAAIGRGRALELLTNAVLPFLAAAGSDEAAALYRRLPRPARYGVVSHLDEALAGFVPVDARRQQGMLFLRRRYCERGRCGSCPLS